MTKHPARFRLTASSLGVALLLAAAAPARGEHVWHVSPTGDDTAAGTADGPLATLERARDRIREALGQDPAGTGSHVILLGPGVHRRPAPFDLDDRDQGLTIRGPADRSARLHAGRPVPAVAIGRVTVAATRGRFDPAAVEHVVTIDLAAAGVRSFEAPPVVFSDGGGLPDLYVDDVPLPLSRWPNEGDALMERVLDRGVWSGKPAERRGGVFVSAPDERGDWRPRHWRVADGVWLEGYWRVPWDPQTIRVAAIDPARRSITHAAAVNGGIGSKYAPKGALGDGREPWCAVNLPEEIDVPGEWCLDLASQVIYLWPPPSPSPPADGTGAGRTVEGRMADGAIVVADQTAPLVRLRDARDVTIERLTIEGGLGGGIDIGGGSGNTVAGCLLRNLGGTAVTVRGGTDNGVRSCDVHTIGEAGIRLSGGDRAALAPCRNFAVNNDVSDVGRRRKTWAAAIHVGSPVGTFEYGDAVGCRVARNALHDLPHAAVLYEGNDNIIEANEVCRVALTSGDVGAFYTRHDWTSHGNVLRRNYVHDCPRANAFYIDDGDSGDTVEENIVVRSGCGPFVGGGHDNTIRRNLIVACDVGIHFDSRGVARGYATHPGYRRRLESARPDAAPWSGRYPGLARLLAPELDAAGVVGAPHGNRITDNVTVGCGKPLRLSGKPAELRDNAVEGNVDLAAAEPLFIDAAADDLRLDPASPVFRALPSFPRLSRDSIGLERDAYRLVVPVLKRPATAPSATPRFDSEKDLDATNRASRAAGG